MSDKAERIGIPGGLALDIVDENFDAERPAAKGAARFLAPKDPRRIHVLAGPPGTGKSAGAAYALMNAKTADRVVGFYDSRDGTRGQAVIPGSPIDARWVHARALWAGVFDRALWGSAERTRILVIDDLGAEPEDHRVTPLIASLLCERVDAGFKTLATTNMDPGLFGKRYGQRVVDRLVGEAWFGTRGPSLRGGKVATR